MSRAEKRRQQKLAAKSGRVLPKQQAADIERSIVLALQYHNAGDLAKAKAIYQQILLADPNQPVALHLLAVLANQVGKFTIALDLGAKAISLEPDYAEAHSCLGNAFQGLGRLDEAVASYLKALTIDPDHVESWSNLAITRWRQGKLDEAIESYQKALLINPESSQATADLATALKYKGKFEEAIQILQSALEKQPENALISKSLMDTLNYYSPGTGACGVYVKAQKALQRVTSKVTGTSAIADETVAYLYRQCHSILAAHKLTCQASSHQIYRGRTLDMRCARHMAVFDTFNVIPEYCFGCYKISIQPQTVVDLFKLMMVFDGLELSNNNTRKCHVEVRSGVSGTYKGWIYCQSLDEAMEIATAVQAILGEAISNGVSVLVKRGCSEFLATYPDFARIDDQTRPLMTYDEKWREHEDAVDNGMTKQKLPPLFGTHDHAGYTLLDALIMRDWLAYAATIGDLSYLKISGGPVQKLQIGKRPSFK